MGHRVLYPFMFTRFCWIVGHRVLYPFMSMRVSFPRPSVFCVSHARTFMSTPSQMARVSSSIISKQATADSTRLAQMLPGQHPRALALTADGIAHLVDVKEVRGTETATLMGPAFGGLFRDNPSPFSLGRWWSFTRTSSAIIITF